MTPCRTLTSAIGTSPSVAPSTLDLLPATTDTARQAEGRMSMSDTRQTPASGYGSLVRWK
jgi:hypothetical protein